MSVVTMCCLYECHLPHTHRGVVALVMRLTPRFLDSSFRAPHQAPRHWLFQLFSDSAHFSSAAASSSVAALPSAVLCLFPTALCWEYWTKYTTSVTREATNSVTMHSHCGSSKPKREVAPSRSDILCWMKNKNDELSLTHLLWETTWKPHSMNVLLVTEGELSPAPRSTPCTRCAYCSPCRRSGKQLHSNTQRPQRPGAQGSNLRPTSRGTSRPPLIEYAR